MLPHPAAPSARRLRRLVDPIIAGAASGAEADRYRKRFPARAHAWMLILHALSGNASLRQSHAEQGADGRLRARLGMPGWISLSQLARSSSSRPSGFFEAIFAALAREARGRAAPGGDPLLRRVAALDATVFSLSLELSPWCEYGRHKPEVRLQTELDLGRGIPASLRLTLPDVNDRRALSEWDLSELAGWTLLFDLGYYAHRHFLRLLEADVSFVTRLQAQAYYAVVASLPVPQGPVPKGDRVLSDELVDLGSPNNRTGAVLRGVRLVTYRTTGGAEHRLVTDRLDLPAREVVALYRRRWDIELFFRRLKRQLGALRPLGYSHEAIRLTVLVAATVALLAYLGDQHRPKHATRVSRLRALAPALAPLLRLSG